MNLPNILTISRIFLVPVFIIFLINHMSFHALLIFIYAGISDGLDGFIARYFNQKTLIGAYLDPLADKLLITSSFICLAILEIIPGWISVIVISRDILILSGIIILYMWDVPFEVKPSFVSKCTTTIQLVTVFLVLVNVTLTQHFLQHFIIYCYVLTAGFSIISGFHYTYKGLNLLQAYTEESGNNKR
ncbi:MAG: CDP-diacylglycerol--glycerol-3-phosphate 3-phosphatidyltransferase [Proteobacteria bacterium]|nr:CDP-diacylglycerol--glycerol-3-phosphate 3-phosphatidyltransferase [Pseudomonadota bacterium]